VKDYLDREELALMAEKEPDRLSDPKTQAKLAKLLVAVGAPADADEVKLHKDEDGCWSPVPAPRRRKAAKQR
jgi:hypothetical protein